MSNPNDNVIRSPEEFERKMKVRRENAKKRVMNEGQINRKEDAPTYSHLDVANQILKVISVLNMHPIVKKIMTMRVMGPLVNGRETTHLQIAIQLGMKEGHVKEIESEGIFILNEALNHVSAKDFIEKFNRNAKVEQAVKEIKQMGKSGKPEVHQKGNVQHEKKRFII